MNTIFDSIKRHATPPMIVALAALLVALSGSAYAGIQLSKNSVGTPQIKNGAVKNKKLGRDVKRKINKARRGPQGPRGPEGPQGRAGLNGLNGKDGQPGQMGPAGMVNWNAVYEVVETRVGSGAVTATCNSDDQVLFGATSASGDYHVLEAGRGNGGREWVVTISSSPAVTGNVVAYCVPK